MESCYTNISSPLLVLFFLFSLLQTSTIATTKNYIVYLGSHSHGENPSPADQQLATESHYTLLATFLGSNQAASEAIFYSYNRYINGFAATLDEKVAEDLPTHPDVISVIENKGRELHTTRSWHFLGLENDQGISSNSIWKLANFGENVIIGNLDTGVWPESQSFSDEGYGPIPSRWKGSCHGGSNFTCNRKLIGARYFDKASSGKPGAPNATDDSARDHDGHGTHTLSTAGGNFVIGANVFGHGNGTAKGGSPRARVATYKVCWPLLAGIQCFDADILAAFEAAIGDGVDVLSVSLGGSTQEFYDDAMAIGAFHAVQQGITVVASAGNAGPNPGSVANFAPWIITVGASTIDRDFASYVALGNKIHIKGGSLSKRTLSTRNFYPLINAEDAASNTSALGLDPQNCLNGSLDPHKAKGKILVCLAWNGNNVDKSYEAARAGAVGIILVNTESDADRIPANAHILPASHISCADDKLLQQYIKSSRSPMAFITNVRTELGIKPAPLVAYFSSRGPNPMEESILKPDITAPGVSIIAAYSQDASPRLSDFDTRRIPFNIESGTSMSCPHISGIVGLLKILYPKWSPAAIRSAIMTTAETNANDFGPISSESQGKADPFAYGAGHVNPNKAVNPGLIYDLSINDYLNFLCARGYNESQLKKFSKTSYVCPKSFQLTNFNYPSISVPGLEINPVTIVRRAKNVGTPGTYVARVEAPEGVSVSVEPSTLKFTRSDEEKTFKVVLHSTTQAKPKGYVFGKLVWSDGKHNVSSPIAVKFK